MSATDISKYSWTPPLQDNVEILLDRLKLAHPWTEVLWKPEWINIKQKLVALIMLAFSVIFDQVLVYRLTPMNQLCSAFIVAVNVEFTYTNISVQLCQLPPLMTANIPLCHLLNR